MIIYHSKLQDIEAGTYPPASPEALISALFLNSAPAQDALEPKLALLSYALVDANLLTAPEVSDSLMKSFSILPSTTQGWLLLLFLDDSQLVPSGEASANSSLAQAVNCIPGIKGSTLPFRALQVFLEKGRGDVALSLLRQRTNDGGGGSRGGASRRDGVAEACAALQVRLANGLLVEAFLEMKRHLGATPEGQRAQHAQQLMAELLNWGVQSQGLHGIIRLPVSPGHEETALVTTLQSDAATLPQAGLMLTLYYLLRGRTVEALTAYARFGRTCTAASAPELADAKAQLEGLLAASARLLPEAQRALVVASGPVPELRTGGEDGVEDAMEIGGGVSVATVVPGVEAPIMSPLLSVGPSPSEAPLVGGVTVMGVAQQAKQGGAHAAASGAPKPDQGSIAMPLLFGSQQAAPAAKPVAQPGSVFGQFGGGQLSGGPGFVGGGHELDKLLGVGAERKAHSIRRGRPMQL